ncbi:MAG: biotin transporter BioY [Deferribacteres bacterium]|nr:biotin transporter BioY [candidate division KSB1 bacterium]MCB9502904.1 biotin transporter BioY [Deferribacteres bacterium]
MNKPSMTNANKKIRFLIPAALFAALTAIGAYIKIPLPPVPVSLQTFFVVLSGLLLGSYYGSTSQILYVTMGLIGLPVFVEGGGLFYIVKPTFGYLVGFIFCAYTIGRLVHGKNRELSLQHALHNLQNASSRKIVLACTAGFVAIYIPGVFYLYFISHFYLSNGLTFLQALIGGCLYFLIWDIVKIVLILLFVKFYAKKAV